MMFRFFFGICLFIEILSIEIISNPCLLINEKLNQENHSIRFQLCGNLSKHSCCQQFNDEQIQNITKFEIDRLFKLYSKDLYDLLFRFSKEIHQTMQKLIDFSRNETHFLFRYGYKTFYQSSHSFIDLFYDNLAKHSSQKANLEKLFQNMFSLIFEISPSKSNCFWKNSFFLNRFNNLTIQLEINLKNYFHLIELFQLNLQLLQTFSTEMIKNQDCIQSYVELFSCNLCSERKEVPCRDSCIETWQGCLGNVKLMNEIWRKFLDSLENKRYFDGIEKDFVSIGWEISKILKDIFYSNANILNQCENLQLKQEFLDIDQEFLNHYNNSFLSSILHSQVISIGQSLETYKSFWLNFSEQICQTNTNPCWKGRTIQRKLPLLNTNFEKILNKTLQINSQQIFQLNLIDDYSDENDVDYSDYLYEDSISESTTTTTTTTTIRIIVEEINTVSYYDYGDQDVYLDDEFEQTSTEQLINFTTSQTPSYHHRIPIIWNINLDEPEEQNNKSTSIKISWLSSLFYCLFLYI